MEISVELTFSPLQDDFEQHIINFIKQLKTAFELMDRGLLYMKLVKSDRSAYEPHF